jgi:cytoskeleton protein RodZ
MVSVGVYLRELRTRRGVSLDEIARKTRVASRYLEALEADAFDDLPAPVFIRGFIRAYCQALGEPPHEALMVYDSRDGRVPTMPARPAPLPRAGTSEPRTRGAIVVSLVLLVVLGMALVTVALVIQPRDRAERSVAEVRPVPPPSPAVSSEPAPVTPAPAPVPPAAPPAAPPPVVAARPPAPPPPVAVTPPPVAARPPAATAPPPPAAAAPAETPTPPPARTPAPASTSVPTLEALGGSVNAPYRLVARISEATWIRVRTEDGRTSEETVPAGEVREWVSDRPFVLTIGNAGGVDLELNGRPLPPLGAKGVVIPRIVLPPEPR